MSGYVTRKACHGLVNILINLDLIRFFKYKSVNMLYDLNTILYYMNKYHINKIPVNLV